MIQRPVAPRTMLHRRLHCESSGAEVKQGIEVFATRWRLAAGAAQYGRRLRECAGWTSRRAGQARSRVSSRALDNDRETPGIPLRHLGAVQMSHKRRQVNLPSGGL